MSSHVGRTRWIVQSGDTESIARLQREVGVSEIMARLLVNRGITEPEQAERFLDPDWDDLPDAFLLPDAQVAVNRILQAIERQERILVYGDYDVDGVTSAALWFHTLSKLRARVQARVLTASATATTSACRWWTRRISRVWLILTCDCGIQAHEVVEHARDVGIDVIITDHHEPGEEVPRALAVVNPHLPHSRYPFPNLSGVGVSLSSGRGGLVRAKGLSPQNYRQHFWTLPRWVPLRTSCP